VPRCEFEYGREAGDCPRYPESGAGDYGSGVGNGECGGGISGDGSHVANV